MDYSIVLINSVPHTITHTTKAGSSLPIVRREARSLTRQVVVERNRFTHPANQMRISKVNLKLISPTKTWDPFLRHDGKERLYVFINSNSRVCSGSLGSTSSKVRNVDGVRANKKCQSG